MRISPARIGSAACLALAAVALSMAWLRDDGRPSLTKPPQATGWAQTDCWVEREPPLHCGWLWPTQQDAAHATALPVLVLQHGATPSRHVTIQVSGGPGGSSYLDQTGLTQWEAWIEQLGLRHDVVLYDARGAGYATPSLDCPALQETLRSQLARRIENEAMGPVLWDEFEHTLQQCVQQVAAADRTARLYSTPTHAADLLELVDALRSRFGYEEVSIYGISNGSRVAVEAAAVAEARGRPVTRLVLDAWYPAGTDLALRTAQTYRETFDDLAAWCAAREECPAAAEWRAGLRRLLDDDAFGGFPREVDLAGYGIDPARTAVALDRWSLWQMLLATLSSGEASEIPQMIDDALAQRWSLRWQTAAEQFAAAELDPGFSQVAFHLAECADGVPTAPADFVREAQRFPEFGAVLLPAVPRSFDYCERLGVAPRPLAPRELRTPALVVGNRIDPVTPWRAALDALPTLANGHLRVLDDNGHGLTDECGLRATGVFLRHGKLGAWRKCELVAERESNAASAISSTPPPQQATASPPPSS